MQLTFSLHDPHWHERCVPTRFTSSLSIWASVCAQTEAARIRKRKLSFNRSMGFCNTYHFGARVRTRHLTWNQTHERAADQHHHAHPDPGHQRENIRLKRSLVAYTRGVV